MQGVNTLPKVKKYEPPRVQREKALLKIIEACKVDKGITKDSDLSLFLGLPQYSYSRYKKNNFEHVDWNRIAEWMHKLGATTEDWCAIGGFPYKEERGNDKA